MDDLAIFLTNELYSLREKLRQGQLADYERERGVACANALWQLNNKRTTPPPLVQDDAYIVSKLTRWQTAIQANATAANAAQLGKKIAMIAAIIAAIEPPAPVAGRVGQTAKLF